MARHWASSDFLACGRHASCLTAFLESRFVGEQGLLAGIFGLAGDDVT